MEPAYPLVGMPVAAPEQAKSPDYGFVFDPPRGYEDLFNFDRCPDWPIFAKATTSPPALEFTDPNLFYRRLFKLADTNGRPRFYLCPWLIVPFDEKPTGGFTVTLKNDLNAAKVTLVARPFLASQPDSIQPATTPGAATAFIRALPQPRMLTLGTSANSPITAVWKKSSNSNQVIDETLCAVSQELEITFNDLAGSSPYPYSSDLTIINKEGLLVGQLCLIFVKMVKVPTILFNVSLDFGRNVEIRQLGQADADKRLNGPNGTDLNVKGGLNKILERSGIHAISNPPQIKRAGDKNATIPGTPIFFDTGKTVLTKDINQPKEITGKFLSTISTIDGQTADFADSTWLHMQNRYLAIFFMSYVKLELVDALNQPSGDIEGYSAFFSRVVHIFNSTPRNIAHEVGHTYGLGHAFHEGDQAEQANFKAAALGLATQSDLYAFFDDANTRGLEKAIRAKWPANLSISPFGIGFFLQALLSPRRYAQSSTEYLMDYTPDGEVVRKDEVDRIRCYA
jgi:hypothetical protein